MPKKEVSMDVQAYRVAVRIALDDQITRNMLQVSRDAIQLNKKFVEMAKNIKTVTSAAKEATSAMRSMNSAMNNQFSGATRGANEYASAMRSAADHAQRASTATRNLPALTGGYGGGSAFPAMAAGAYALSAGSAGGGGGARRGNGLMSLPGPQGQGGGWGGWNNGVPPGGWGGGGSGGGGNGSSNRGFGPGSHADGMTNLATGYLGLKVLGGFVDEAAKYQTISEKFNQFKMGDAALKDAQKYADAQKIKGTSDSEMLMLMVEAQGVFRQTHSLDAAKLAAPVMAKLGYASRGLDQHQREATEAKQMDMLRFVETAGGLKSPQRFNDLMDAGFRAIQSSGGNVDFTQYRQFMAKAGTSAFNLSNKALFAELEPIIGELKGSSAGDALMTSYNRLNGIVKLPNQVTRDLMEMGVWDKNKIELNKMGGIKRFTGNPLVNSKLFSESPIDYYKQMILPIYKKNNFSEDQIQRENALIFGRTGGKMFNLVDKQMETIQHSVELFNQSRGLNDSYNAVSSTYNGKKIDFEKKWENLQLVMGKEGGVLDTFTSGLTKLTDLMQRMTDIAHRHPELAKFVGQAALAVTALASVSGSIWLMKHATGALIGPLKFLTGSSGFPLLEKSLGTLPNAVTLAIGGVLAASTVEIYNRIKALKEDRPYDQIASHSAEMSERDRLAHENAKANGGSYKPWSPSQADFDAEKGRYPSVPPKSSSANNQPVNLLLTHEGRQVLVATVIGGMSKQATKAPSSTSAFDSSMLMAYPGQVSKLSTPN